MDYGGSFFGFQQPFTVLAGIIPQIFLLYALSYVFHT